MSHLQEQISKKRVIENLVEKVDQLLAENATLKLKIVELKFLLDEWEEAVDGVGKHIIEKVSHATGTKEKKHDEA